MRTPGLTLLTLVLAGCGGADPEYYPLNEGWLWRYRIVVTTEERTWEQRYIIRNLPAQSRPEGSIVPRQTIDDHRQYYRVNDDGIERLRLDEDRGQDRMRANRVLASPQRTGESWHGKAATVALIKVGPPQETLFRVSVEVPMIYTIELTDDRVSVPAGDFSNCLRVHGIGQVNIDAGNYVGRTNVTIESWDWYAPGVGLVKSSRRETTTSAALKFGEFLMELQSLDK